MKAETPAQMASLVLAHLGNVFGGLHYGVEVELAGGEDAVQHPARRESLALAAEARVKATMQTALDSLEEGEHEVNRIGLVVGRALAEDFLLRVDPVLNEEGDARGESDTTGDLFAGTSDPAPDTTL